MQRILLTLAITVCATAMSMAQIFDEEITIPAGFTPDEILMPPSPLTTQVLFVGGVDLVQTTPTYGNEAGVAYAKEWHDFIGFTNDEASSDLGWVTVNHEAIFQDNRIGDGGGMTVFKVRRAGNGDLEIVEQTLDDGRRGEFFNVDFVNTVGETGMNCGGIQSSVDGRIWTAEEWFRSSQSSINNGGFSEPTSAGAFPKAPGPNTNQGVRDTSDYTISTDIPGFDGLTVKKYENFNYMVEVDPRQARAVRKQYNWGRQGFEGGVVASDNKTVYLGVDATPAFWCKFVADNAGDFTEGKLYVYKHDADPKWIEVDNRDPAKMLNFAPEAVSAGATMYNRIEWVAYDETTGKVYMTETGRDNPGGRWADDNANGAVHAPHHMARAADQGVADPNASEYWDYYGRVLEFDPATEEMSVHIEGGPYFEESPAEGSYPSKHLSNPDGLNVITIDNQQFLAIEEDLNGTSFGRTPAGVSNRLCELYILDLSIEDPSIDDLIRITAIPAGAEITGCVQTPDGRSLLVNSQHPSSANPFPYNHSLTFAIHGWDELTVTDVNEPNFGDTDEVSIYPNPATRVVYISETTDAAVYNADGRRIKVVRESNTIDVSAFPSGIYFVKLANGDIKKLVIE